VRKTLVFTTLLLPFSGAGQALPRFGAEVTVSTLGIGVDAATAVTQRSNVRVGFNAFNYSRTFSKDGIRYDGELSLRSFEILYDQYLVGGFHISPGLLAYDGNQGTANASVPGGQSFSLGGATYVSSPANPASGTGVLDTRKVAPMVLLGVGNLLPRSARHFTVNFEGGVVFQGSPKATLNLQGAACVSSFCQDIASTPAIQSNIQAEQTKINNSVGFFKYYPVLSVGFGYKF
jgi:hypothetical protein